MKNVFEGSLKLLSKNDIIKKFSNIKTSRNKNTKKNYISRNNYDLNLLSKGSKNLTYQNFHTEKNVKNILEKKRNLKNDLLSYSGYSSFNVKSTSNFKLNSDFPLKSVFSQDKMKIGKKYNRLFSSRNIIGKKNIENISYDRTKTSTTKITKTNNLNCNTSSNRNVSGLLSPYSNRTNKSKISNKFLNYRVNSCFLKTPSRNLNRESVSSFLEKTRIIRKEKILKHNLEHIYDNESEINKEKLFLFNKNKYDFQKYVSLFNIYYKSYNLYLKNLEMEKAKGNQICNQLIKQKIDLGLENQRIRHQINKLEIKKIRYKNLLELLKSIKYGLNNSKTEIMSRNHILNKHKKISLSETNNNNKKNNFKKFFYINKLRRNSRNMNISRYDCFKN